LRKKIQEDIWVNCPECKSKLKQQNLKHHMKSVHNKKIDDLEIKPLNISNNKRQVNKTKKFRVKMTIGVIVLIFVILVASISVYFLYSSEKSSNQSKDSDVQNNKGSYIVSFDGKGNYSSIQEAIDSASNNNTIFVRKGIYYENIIITKPIELIGEDRDTTIINGNGSLSIIHISADYVKISGFTITNSSRTTEGIKIRGSYNIISDCNISSNENYGLYLQANPTTTSNIIKFNTFYNNDYGIFSTNAKTNNISSNTFTHNTVYALYLSTTSNDNLISDNKFMENNYAIRIKSSLINKVINNLIKNNQYGLYFCCGAENNIAYNNFFINNTNWNANDALGNKWDNGVVGNYWDDYTGKDQNGDGIGDTPYLIGGDKGDNFPLMEPK